MLTFILAMTLGAVHLAISEVGSLQSILGALLVLVGVVGAVLSFIQYKNEKELHRMQMEELEKRVAALEENDKTMQHVNEMTNIMMGAFNESISNLWAKSASEGG